MQNISNKNVNHSESASLVSPEGFLLSFFLFLKIHRKMLQVPFAIQSDYRNVLSIIQLWIFLQKNPSELEKFSAILSSVCVCEGVSQHSEKNITMFIPSGG